MRWMSSGRNMESADVKKSVVEDGATGESENGEVKLVDIKGDVSETGNFNTEQVMIEKLTEGLTTELLPQLQELREKTKELTKNQAVLIETIQQENRKFSEDKEIEEFNEMVETVRSYYAKLKNIKSEMDQLDEKMGKLKKRSLKLKEKRLKKELDEAQKRERELALERELTAKPAT